MASIGSVLDDLRGEDAFYRVTNNPRLQLGQRNRPFLMSRFLPEVQKDARVIREEALQIRSIIARDAPRSAPVTLRGQNKVGRITAEMIDSNTGASFEGEMYEGIQRMLMTGNSMQAMADMLNYSETQVGIPLAMLREKYRCDAIVNARIIRQGDGDFYEVVDYDNPPGNRYSIPSGTVGSPAGWHSPTYDLYQDLVGIRDTLLADFGLTINATITTTKMKSLINRNTATKTYGGSVTVVQGGAIGSVDATSPQMKAIYGAMAFHDLPSREGVNFFTYDSRYDIEVQGGTANLTTSTERFIPNNVFIMICSTGRNGMIDLPDSVNPIPLFDTLGYTGIGKVIGEARPGVKIQSFLEEKHPPHIEFEGVQCALPVIQDPKCIIVLTINDPV